MSRMATMNIHDRGDGVISWNQVRQRILALADDGPYEPDAPARIPRARPSLARRVSMDGEAQTWPERVPESFGAPGANRPFFLLSTSVVKSSFSNIGQPGRT